MHATMLLLALAPIKVSESEKELVIETDALEARIVKKGYVSGIGRLRDKKTGAVDLGFGLHIMDFLLAPGWRDDGYARERKWHGDLPKHHVEGPQVCTQAKELKPEMVKGTDWVAVKLKFTFTEAGKGYAAGSTWEQTMVFQQGLRYAITSERITSANDVKDLFYRIDMPGHVKHKSGDNFTQVYLSYLGKPLDAKEFRDDFAPDARFLYQRGKEPPKRMIRAYRTKAGPWLAGMTLDPSATSEAWCHQRGYICFIQELHRRDVKKGESFGAAYLVGWFDDIAAMEKEYDRHKGAKAVKLGKEGWKLE